MRGCCGWTSFRAKARFSTIKRFGGILCAGIVKYRRPIAMKSRSGKVTRENKPAAQSAARRAASLLTGTLLLAGLAGCSSDFFQFSDNANPSLTKAKPAVALSPAQGVPPKYAAKLNDQLAASIKSSGLALVDAKDAVYVIKPSYAAASEKHGTKLAYTIDVTDKAGNKVRTITGEEVVSAKHGGDAWRHVTDEGLQKVAFKSAGDVNAWIDNPNAPVAVAAATPAPAAPAAAKQPAAPVRTAARTAPKAPAAAQAPAETASLAAAVEAPVPARPAAPAEVVALVPIVSGAPGDGKTALAEAMKRALGRQGIKLASSAAPGAYRIQGSVEMGQVANGQQPITIRWVVIDPNGKQMEKTVVQNNRIGAGSLDGTWGDVAEQAASAAASEVTKLLSKSSGQAQATTNTAG